MQGKGKVSVTHSGKQHAYHLAQALLRLGLLERFYTSSYVTSPLLQRLISSSGNTFFSRRFQPGLAAPYVSANWKYELREMLIKTRQGRGRAFSEAVYARDIAFDKATALRVARDASTLYWGFQGSAHHTLQAARAAGKRTMLELTTAYPPAVQAILAEEARLQPDWADSLDNLTFPPAYEKRMLEEPWLADYAVAASPFTAQTLVDSGYDAAKIYTIPLGFDGDYIPYTERIAQPKRPFRLLYAGNITQGKGIAYLLEAMGGYSKADVELHIVGYVRGNGNAFKAMVDRYTYHGPVAQHTLFGMYGDYDALVLPTLADGFGLVLVEALAAGTPIITTPNCIGPALIDDGDVGRLVPIRDVAALQGAIGQLAGLPQDAYLAMRRSARAKAESFSWRVYQQHVGEVVRQLLG